MVSNPFSFRPGPVTFWTTVTYLALLIPIIIINEETPPAPSEETPIRGTNLTEAWLDLTTLTRAYHPYNSHYNDDLRGFLLERIRSILDDNEVAWTMNEPGSDNSDAAVTVFDDLASNCTFLMSSGVAPAPNTPQVAAYFEGTNILVYIRGKSDDQGKWWDTAGVHDSGRNEKGLTLVNAHYDSVSTGYGATDDGMGVVTCLQLIQYFTRPENRPERGIVVMLNNGEEDYLYGARALGQHSLNPYIHTFLNLEGAGAGGRAILFRTTDREVTAAYAGSPDPFGTVIGSDAFGLGFIRSGTDYSVLYDVFGQRGLDLAFFKPRARYHTNQDDARHASKGSLWHMLSASIHTATQLSSDTGNTFIGPRSDGASGKVHNGSPSDGVWFDLFGKGFVLFGLRGMFAWSLTVLIATPLILMLLSYLLHRADKYYLFSSSVKPGDQPDDEALPVGGWKGFFRFPFALVVAGSLTIGAAFLMRKVNPFIIYSSRYSVLAMMVSLFYFTFWAIMRGANFARPSALHRVYVQIWLFILGWAMLVAVTVAEDRLRIGAGYMFVFLQSSVFLSLFVALCELFALPKKTTWAQKTRDEQEERDFLRGRSHGALSPSQLPPAVPNHESTPPGTRHSNHTASTPINPNENGDGDDATDAPTERTPLVGGNADQTRTTFATTYRRSISALVTRARRYSDSDSGGRRPHREPFEHEQAWSGRLPAWTWFLQFLLLGPFTVVLAAQTALMLVDAVHQTGADGSSLLMPYLIVALGVLVLLLPLAPFVHRVSHHVPVFLAAVFVATLVYNLVAFPFSPAARYKVYFVQTLDLETDGNRVCYHGIEEYLRTVVASLPSASGRDVDCTGGSKRAGLVSCCFDGAGTPPRLTAGDDGDGRYGHLVAVNASHTGGRAARIEVVANNTKACFLEFEEPVSGLSVHGSSGWDERFGQFPDAGVKNLRMWHRRWDEKWVVDVEWKDGEAVSADDTASASSSSSSEGDWVVLGDEDLRKRGEGLKGTVVCMWSDANVPGTIPALDEALQFVPAWVAVTKLSEGLVEGRRAFEV
ncbi:putative zinc metalloprotease [Chaetomium sp. MPI-CAGE-AT-0009]|nr:putative zinc metalloprotease [Chaetomium sp. MPI-CAGE-AT-0009]